MNQQLWQCFNGRLDKHMSLHVFMLCSSRHVCMWRDVRPSCKHTKSLGKWAPSTEVNQFMGLEKEENFEDTKCNLAWVLHCKTKRQPRYGKSKKKQERMKQFVAINVGHSEAMFFFQFSHFLYDLLPWKRIITVFWA